LGADAVIYGAVKSYEAYDLGLMAAWRVEVEIKIASTHAREVLVEAKRNRFDTNFLIVLTPEDIGISSAEIRSC